MIEVCDIIDNIETVISKYVPFGGTKTMKTIMTEIEEVVKPAIKELAEEKLDAEMSMQEAEEKADEYMEAMETAEEELAELESSIVQEKLQASFDHFAYGDKEVV
jgi:polyribonucleotide nucleotidyltransferase